MRIIFSVTIVFLAGSFFSVGCKTNSTTNNKNQQIEIVEVVSETGRTWMDRNLGSERVAQSSNDRIAYGDLYQWGRFTDGHEKRDSFTSNKLMSDEQTGKSDFILTRRFPYNWSENLNNGLWQGVKGLNNPCPENFRIPTVEEWENEFENFKSRDSEGAFDTTLKLTLTGFRTDRNGVILNEDSIGYYWASDESQESARVYGVSISSISISVNTFYRARGMVVRCIKNEI